MRSRLAQTRSRRGFTLVELLAAVVILALLAGIASSRFFNHRQRALRAAEDAVVRSVRAGISQYVTSGAVAGGGAFPTVLDAAPANASASLARPLFDLVLTQGVTDAWRKGSTALEYVGPFGTTYTYDPSTGAFSGTPGTVTGDGAIASPGSSTSLATSANWTAGGSSSVALGPGVYVGSGYSLANGVLSLDYANASSLNLANRRMAMAGIDASAGNFTLTLETVLDDYASQYNYWQILLVQPGTNIALDGSGTAWWGNAPPGAKLVTQGYAPPEKSNGSWYTYTHDFTISAQDAATYSQVIVLMGGSRQPTQQLGWRNVNFTKN